MDVHAHYVAALIYAGGEVPGGDGVRVRASRARGRRAPVMIRSRDHRRAEAGRSAASEAQDAMCLRAARPEGYQC